MGSDKAKLLGAFDIDGDSVSFFSPPHAEPDFPWVDVDELVFALTKDVGTAKRMVSHSQRFGEANDRVCVAVKNGDKVTTIIPHPIAQGLCGALDAAKGFVPADEDDNGPIYWKYCTVASDAANTLITDFTGILLAFKNLGGPYLRD